MLYTSLENKKIKEIKKLNQKKYRDLENKFLIEGEHLILEAYKKGVLEILILDENTKLNLDIETMYVTNEVLKYISELDTPPKIIGVCRKQKNDIVGNKILVLDQIQDPGNLGTIIRSMAAFSFDTLILSNDSVDLYNQKVIRATQGMIFNTNIVRCNLKDFLPKLKESGYKIIGTKVIGGKDIKSIEKNDKVAIIMGNEGSGISELTESLCDEFIYIKMNEKCESLNVGVAASIILYELGK